MTTSDMKSLEYSIDEITEIATGLGLDFYSMRYEICPSDIIYTFGAYVLDSNSLVQNKLIIAHVLAHCDFFKNKTRFSKTNRNMVESMTSTAERYDIWSLDISNDTPANQDQPIRFPPQPEKDILWFIKEYSSKLEPWQRRSGSMITIFHSSVTI